MLRTRFVSLPIGTVIQFSLFFAQFFIAIAQEWAIYSPRGTLKVVELTSPSVAAMWNYAEALVPY
jgi:hypothetical protein